MLEGFSIRDGKENRYLSVELDGTPESAWEYVLLRYADDRFDAGIPRCVRIGSHLNDKDYNPMVLFDKQDVDLFRPEDQDLKAQAIRNSIIPRLLEVVNSAVENAGEVYGVEPMEGMTLSFAPRSRERKGVHSARDCRWAYSGLVPRRKKKNEGDWIPVSLRIVCYEPRFRKRFFKLFRQNEVKLLGLLAALEGRWSVFNGETRTPLSCPLGRSLDAFENGKICFLSFRSCKIRFPRSKGGGGSLDNLQTLGRECNIGKSNKSDRNLRKRASRPPVL